MLPPPSHLSLDDIAIIKCVYLGVVVSPATVDCGGNSIAAGVVPLMISKVDILTFRFQFPALERRRQAHFHLPSLHVGIKVSALDGMERVRDKRLVGLFNLSRLSLSLSSLSSSPIVPSRRAVITVSGGEEVRKCDIKQLQERVAKTLSQNKDAEKWIFGRCVVLNGKISR